MALLVLLLAAGFISVSSLKTIIAPASWVSFSRRRTRFGVDSSVTQSKIAIGDGGLLGKGYGQGTQTQLGFLSEPTEAFIFAAVIEEWGLLGGLVVCAEFAFLIFQILRIGMLADENFEKFICLGTAMMFAVRLASTARPRASRR